MQISREASMHVTWSHVFGCKSDHFSAREAKGTPRPVKHCGRNPYRHWGSLSTAAGGLVLRSGVTYIGTSDRVPTCTSLQARFADGKSTQSWLFLMCLLQPNSCNLRDVCV